jgi:hypothetical protein
MIQIKTITYRIDNAEEFDTEVNQAIAKGWELTERKVLQPQAQPHCGSIYSHRMLYAELEKGREPVLKEAPKADIADVCEALVRLLAAQATCWEADVKALERDMVEKSCETCKHTDKAVVEDPCHYCHGNLDKWEPKA